MTELSVNIEQTIHAPIDRVFDAWLDPAMLARFILPMRGMPMDSRLRSITSPTPGRMRM